MDTKHRLKPVHVAARLPWETAGMGTPWIDAWLLRTYPGRPPCRRSDNVLSVSVPFAAGIRRRRWRQWVGNAVAAVIAGGVGSASLGTLGHRLRRLFRTRAATSFRVRVVLPREYFPSPNSGWGISCAMHTRRSPSRRGDTATFTASEKSLKKKMLLAGTCQTTAAGAELSLTIGSRAFLKEWLESFGDTRTVRRALVEVLYGVTPAPWGQFSWNVHRIAS